MARAERYTSTEPVTVKRAGIIDPSDFRFSNISALLLGQVGQTFEKLGIQYSKAAKDKFERQQEVLLELSRRNAEAENSLAINQAVESRNLAKLEMREFMANNPEPDTWSKGAEKILAEQGKIYSQQRFNAKTRAEQEIEQQAFKDKLNTEVGIAAVTQNIENDIAISGKNLIDVISTDDGSPEMAADILDQQKTYQEALERKYPKDIAAIHMEETLKEAEEQTIENAKKDIMNRAALRPELFISSIDTELKARAKGKKAIRQFALLSNTDLEAIRDYAGSVGEKAVSDSEIAVNAAIVDAYGKIRNGETDIDSLIDAIETDPTISDEDKLQAAEKIPTYFNKINSTKVALESNNDVYDVLTQASESVERGAMSPAAFEELYADNKGFLTGIDQRAIRSKDIVATKTMQNRAFSEGTTNNYSRLVELRDDELTGLIAARDNALRIKDLKTVNALNFSIKKAQVQKWNYGRFRMDLRSQIAQNEDWSQKQIFAAADILVDSYDKPIADLMLEFEKANPNRSILKTPPDDEFKDIWKDLPDEDKAKVWELRLAGATVKEILGAI